MLKRVVFVLIGIALLTNLRAQNYVPFPDSNAFWEVAYYNDIYCPPPNGYCGTLQYYFKGGDTIINSRLYRQLYHANLFNYNGNGYFGGLRQDTLERKVFLYPSNSHQEILLYDFNLNIGDTLPLSYFNIIKCYVVDIDTVNIGGVLRKKFILKSNPAYYCSNCYYIEGIGGSSGLAEPYGYSEGGSFLVCFKQNDTTFFSPYGYCDIIDNLSVQEAINSESSFKVYPNPLTDITTIETTNNKLIKTIRIYNLLGQEVYYKEVGSKQKVQLYRNDLVAGIFVYRVQTEDGNMFTGKLVVE